MVCSKKRLEIVNSEKKYHQNKEFLTLSCYVADPVEVEVSARHSKLFHHTTKNVQLVQQTLNDERENALYHPPDPLNSRLVVTIGADKNLESTHYSLKCHTRRERNNSATKQRPFALWFHPAKDSGYNLRTILGEYRDKIKSLKCNASELVLHIRHSKDKDAWCSRSLVLLPDSDVSLVLGTVHMDTLRMYRSFVPSPFNLYNPHRQREIVRYECKQGV